MASNPCADALADLITVIVTPIPWYTNIASIPPHYYNSIKGRNTEVKSSVLHIPMYKRPELQLQSSAKFFLISFSK